MYQTGIYFTYFRVYNFLNILGPFGNIVCIFLNTYRWKWVWKYM